jgi:hypothetical protein
LQKFTSAFKQSRSSLLSGVKGLEAMGKSPRSRFAAGGEGVPAHPEFPSAIPAATEPSVFRAVRRFTSFKKIDKGLSPELLL